LFERFPAAGGSDRLRAVLLSGAGFIACLVMALSAAGSALDVMGSIHLVVGAMKPAELPGLHNVFRVSEKLYSGSAPEGEPGFQSLRKLGIRTVITVDGARPDVAAARRYGLRYVHLPFGYDGCPTPRALEIVRAVRDLPGPIYLHCHHGQHRSPAAAALVHIALDGASNAEALAYMRRAGTDPVYTGLYGDAASFRRPAAAEINRASRHFPETAVVPPLADAMVRIDDRFAALQRIQKSGWQSPAGEPDRDPAHEALQLRELFHELQRTGASAGRPRDFRGWLRDAERGSAVIEASLRAGDRGRTAAALGRVAAACGACHARYRNIPQARGPGAEETTP
jgi:protein tyrosine phosphatase (PTP) superfamily phosphohydrolase (DUF442 family)